MSSSSDFITAGACIAGMQAGKFLHEEYERCNCADISSHRFLEAYHKQDYYPSPHPGDCPCTRLFGTTPNSPV